MLTCPRRKIGLESTTRSLVLIAALLVGLTAPGHAKHHEENPFLSSTSEPQLEEPTEGIFDSFKRDWQKLIEEISPSSESPADDGESSQTNEVDWSKLLGTWEGVASRPEAGIYDVDITINSSREGQNCGSIDYTSLDCGGTLICKGTAGEFATFEERLTMGQSRCVDRGLVFVRESNGGLEYLWRRGVNGRVEARGRLARPES